MREYENGVCLSSLTAKYSAELMQNLFAAINYFSELHAERPAG